MATPPEAEEQLIPETVKATPPAERAVMLEKRYQVLLKRAERGAL